MHYHHNSFLAAKPSLEGRFEHQFSTSDALRAHHTHTTTWLEPQLPDGVIFAESEQDVIDAVNIAQHYKIPIIPFGVGSSLEGQLNAPHGGISIDFTKMNNIIDVYQDDLSCVVEPGVTRRQLNEYLRDTGLFFPIDPGADATIGGMAATRASGTNAVRYGTMKDNIIAIEAVMANGEKITTATRAKKTSAGYDLTRLLIGSEGTLGVITKITLKLYGIPEKIGGAICQFNTCHDACQSVIQTIQYGLNIARIEYVDPVQIRACNAYSNLNLQEVHSLFCEFHGSDQDVQEQMNIFRDITEDNNVVHFDSSTDEDKRQKLWQARHDAFWAAKALAPEKQAYVTDVCVPISRLAEAIDATTIELQDKKLLSPVVGHVGDGNFHCCVFFDPNDADETKKMKEFSHNLIQRAIDMGGTCTGEHGIGQGKKDFLKQELGNEALHVMRIIKQSLDPNNIMNPAKIF